MQEQYEEQFRTEQIQMSIKQASDKIELGEALERLSNNEDWKKIILTEMFEKETQRLVFLKSEPSMSEPGGQAAIDGEIKMIGNFRQFCRRIMREAQMSKKAIEDYRQLEQELDDNRDEDHDYDD